MIDINKMADEGIEVIDYGANWSSAGRNYTTLWQELSLSENSVRLQATACHELLHALALAHEMNRDDAFYFIKLNPSNRDEKWIENYEPLKKTDNFGFTYDFGSLMHYWAEIDENGYYNIITMGRFYQRTIGKIEKPSFKDLAIINHIYCRGVVTINVKERKTSAKMEAIQTQNNAMNAFAQKVMAVHIANSWNRPKKGEKVIIKLNKLDEKALSCAGICGTNHVEIKYRKDKRARGALLCCANDILQQNMPRNWIEAEEKDVDIIISARIATTDATELFGLTYETDGAKLLSSCACADPHLLFDPKRSPSHYCEPPCKADSTCNMKIGGCGFGFLAKREGSAESFWYYWKQKDIEPMRVEEVHCVKCDREKDKGCKYKP
ncbi:hypothetical protein niasHT_003641 [Heterodera trifolii]|uniref:Peptidase M12A domain-containing protein n=1 Tax=Heterodera trifolii TaxID=157864 RepID=A0ABD2MEU7_9BILA